MTAAALGPAAWLGSALFGVAGAIGSQLLSKPKPPAAPLAVTRNAAAEAAMRDDMMRRRRGAGANEITGGGAEARSPGGKALLGQ